MPTQAGPLGIRFDFNLGARVLLPEGHWRMRLMDADTGDIPFENEDRGALVGFSKRWFVRFRLDVRDLSSGAAGKPVFTHEYNARGRVVLVHYPVGT